MQTYRVLIADDERPVRRLLERICNQLGWESHSAEDGNVAVELMEQNEYQIFTVDVNMPGPSGIDLARKILNRYESPSILILTGYAEVKQAVQATKEGVYNYIQKDDVEVEDIKTYLQQAAQFHENLKKVKEAQKQREQSIQDLEITQKQFQALIDLSLDMLLLVDISEMKVTDCNPAACNQLKYSRSTLIGTSIQLHIPSLTPQIIQERFLKDSSQLKAEETTVTTEEGNLIEVEIALTFVCLQQGVFLAIMMRDITERKALQAAILHERNLLHLLMNNIPDSIYFKDKNLQYTRINKAMAKRFGLQSIDLAINKTAKDFFVNSKADELIKQETQIIDSNTPMINDINEYQLHDGTKHWYSTTSVPLSNSDGNIEGLIGISRDITAEKAAEVKIRHATQQLEIQAAEMDAILEGIEEGILLTNESLEITQVNAWFEACVNIPKEFLLGENILHVFAKTFDVEIEKEILQLQNLDSSEIFMHKFQYQTYKLVATFKSINIDDTFMGMICSTHNISELIDENKASSNTVSNNEVNIVVEDISTPLHGMLELTKQLSGTQLSLEQKLIVDAILSCGDSVSNLLPLKHS